MTNKFIVVIGNLCDGFKFYGPFGSFDDAAESPQGREPDSWVASLGVPTLIFKVGDVVRVKSRATDDDAGTVVKNDGEQHPGGSDLLCVKFGDKRTYYYAHELEPLV